MLDLRRRGLPGLHRPGVIPPHLRCNPAHAQCSIDHARLVDEYREERYRQEVVRESECMDYAAEIAEYNETHDMITFKKWLVGSAGRNRV